MGLMYDFYQNPLKTGSEQQPTFHARVKTTGTTGTKEVSELINAFTSLSPSDVRAALDALAQVMTMELSQGRRVHLEGLGYFQLTLSCPPLTAPTGIRAESIALKSVGFRPEVSLMSRFHSVSFERAREKNHSAHLPEEEIEALLTAYFREKSYLTRQDFARLGRFTRATSLRRLNQLIAEGKLCKSGYRNAPLYQPVRGYYGR